MYNLYFPPSFKFEMQNSIWNFIKQKNEVTICLCDNRLSQMHEIINNVSQTIMIRKKIKKKYACAFDSNNKLLFISNRDVCNVSWYIRSKIVKKTTI